MRSGTTQPGRYTLQALIDVSTTNAHAFSGSAAASAMGRWESGNDTVVAGSVSLARDASSPNPLIERHYTQRNTHTVVRATVVVDVLRPADNGTIAVLVAKALANAGLGVPYGPISQGFMGASTAAPVFASTLTIAPWRRPASRPAPRPAPSRTSGAPAAPSAAPLPPTPPVPLTPAQRLQAGPVTDSTDPARIGTAQPVFSHATLYEATTGGEWRTLAAVVAVTVLVLVGVGVAVSTASEVHDD